MEGTHDHIPKTTQDGPSSSRRKAAERGVIDVDNDHVSTSSSRDSNGEVVNMHAKQPNSTTPRPRGRPARSLLLSPQPQQQQQPSVSPAGTAFRPGGNPVPSLSTWNVAAIGGPTATWSSVGGWGQPPVSYTSSGNPFDYSSSRPLKVQEAKKAKVVKAENVCVNVLEKDLRSDYHVLQEEDGIYDAMLTLTNVEDDENQFYVIQVLESNRGSSYMVYSTWGRVGWKGEDSLLAPYSSKSTAIQEFDQKFYEKTKNHWSERKNFVSYPKCYTWLEIEYIANEKKAQGMPSGAFTESQIQKSILDPRVARFIALISNMRMMRQQMMELGYNAEKLPLQNLSLSTILKGYDVLKLIADVIDQASVDITGFVAGEANRKLLELLSGEFYSIIPHDFGTKKMSEFLIDSPKKLKRAVEMVESLGEIAHATRLFANGGSGQDDPLYVRYQRLHCELVPVEANSEEYSMIEMYMQSTSQNSSYNRCKDIVQIFKVTREGENEHFNEFADQENRMLLWHGSRLANWIGILSRGLRIAPPEAPASGASFGRGVYFADMYAKSITYCRVTTNPADAVLLLCEVALGEMQELKGANSNAHRLPPGKLSTKGLGMTVPSTSQVLKDGVIVPSGPAVKIEKGRSMAYNEYIVYNEDQIRMRYLVHLK